MNLEEQRVSGISQIHLTDALNAALLELKIGKQGSAMAMPTDFIIYVDKENKDNPTTNRKEYHFNLSSQLNYNYAELDESASDKFIIKMAVENNRVIMKTYVERYVSYDEEGNKISLLSPEIEVLETLPIILFEGENYIYTNYTDTMSIELVYPKNTEANKMYLNSAIYYSNKGDGDFSLEDIYFKDAFTKTEDKLNLEVNNAKINCLTSKNNKFSLDEEGNLTVNSIQFNENNANILAMYPVGSIYMSVNATNPSEYFGGTWVSWGAGRVPVGMDTTQAEFNAIEKMGGEKSHTLSISEIPAHSHGLTGNGAHTHTYTGFIQCATAANQNYTAIAHKRYNADGTSTPASMNSSGGHSHSISNNGGSQSHNNLQPYITCYMWKRTA